MKMQKSINEEIVSVEFVSVKNLGIKPVGDEWLNFDSDHSKVNRDAMQTLLSTVRKGSKVKITLSTDKGFTDLEVLEQPVEQELGTSFDNVLIDFVKKYPNYSKRVDTEFSKIDFENKIALVRVVVCPEGDDKREVDGIGDATSENVKNASVRVHFVRMAETRAFARAIRFILGTNVVKEELSGDEKK